MLNFLRKFRYPPNIPIHKKPIPFRYPFDVANILIIPLCGIALTSMQAMAVELHVGHLLRLMYNSYIKHTSAPGAATGVPRAR